MDEGSTLTVVGAADAHIIERPRLTTILDESNARVILLVAPAGYGKTTLARQWLRDREHVWYQATAASADPVVLATHLQRLLDPREGGRTTIHDLIAADPSVAEDPRALAEAVVDQTPTGSAEILAIDDYHFVGGSPLADQLVRELLDQDPWRLLLTTRIRPCSMATRDVVYGGTCEITTADLSMCDDEIRLVLHGTPQAEQIAASACGWPALIGLAVRAPTLVPLPETRPSLVYEFLADELLRDAPESMEQLLVEIALAPSRSDPAEAAHPELIRDAVARGLLQRDGEQIAMHPVLADFLKRRLRLRPDGEEVITETATLLLETGAWDDAFALIDEFDRADLLGRLLEAAPALLKEGRFETTQRLQKTAERLVYEGAVLDYLRADTACRRGFYLDAIRLGMQAAEQCASRSLRAKSLLVAGRAAKFNQLPADATRLLDMAADAAITPEDILEAGLSRSMTIIDFELDEDDRLDALQGAMGAEPEAVLRLATARMHKACSLGPVSLALQAAEEGQQVLAAVEAPWARSAFLALHGFALLLSANYPAARRVCAAALVEASRTKFEFATQQIRLLMALADLGEGRNTAAARRTRGLVAETHNGGNPALVTSVTALRIRLLVAQGLARDAIAEAQNQPPHPVAPGDIGQLAAVQALAFACTGQPCRALELIEQAKANTRFIEVTVLADAAAAIAQASDGVVAPARELIRVAEATGNFDACVAALRGSDELRRVFGSLASEDASYRGVAQWLLSMVGSTRTTAAPDAPENLSPRETGVLELLAQGLTNKQIATALFISDATVKVHLRHIFKKLGVRTRTEAALLARDSGDDVTTICAEDGAA